MTGYHDREQRADELHEEWLADQEKRTRRERHGVIGKSEHEEYEVKVMTDATVLARLRKRLSIDVDGDVDADGEAKHVSLCAWELRLILDAADSIPLGADGQLVMIGSWHWVDGVDRREEVEVLEISKTEAKCESTDGDAAWYDFAHLHSKRKEKDNG